MESRWTDYSTNHALISLSLFFAIIISITEYIHTLLDYGHYVCGIFVESFDTVNHKILCEKLRYNLRGNVN